MMGNPEYEERKEVGRKIGLRTGLLLLECESHVLSRHTDHRMQFAM
jgi:hypothetical protein